MSTVLEALHEIHTAARSIPEEALRVTLHLTHPAFHELLKSEDYAAEFGMGLLGLSGGM